jgi:hypothetical protein
MINEEALKTYLLQRFRDAVHVGIRRLGSGVQGSGFLVEIKTTFGMESYVVKTLLSEGLGHDYPSDRAAVFLLDLDEYKNLPRHVKAIDVLSEMEDGSVKSVGGGREYYLLMERAEGRHYFHDLAEFSGKSSLEGRDVLKIEAMTSYLAGIHSVKKDSKHLYWRKLRDTVGHGECLMGVFDTYPDGVISYDEMAEIIKKSVDWVMKLKPAYGRLSQIHGDFHPGNIWFHAHGGAHAHSESHSNGDTDFVLLDRSRGPWGDPADDVTALTINYVFFSIKNYGDVRGAYLEGLVKFFDLYLKASGDAEMPEVVAPFFAFRGAVVANPMFYPELTMDQRRLIFRFVHNVLDDQSFEVTKVNKYLG